MSTAVEEELQRIKEHITAAEGLANDVLDIVSTALDAVSSDSPPDNPDSPPATEEAPTEAIAGELGHVAEQYDAAAVAERRAETPDEDVEGVFDGPYDPVKAMNAITRLNREVQAADADYQRSKEETSALKKVLDGRQSALSRLIGQYDQRSKEGAQPYLKTVADRPITVHGESVRACCEYERRTGLPCAVCRTRPAGEIVARSDPRHPEHQVHVPTAARARFETLSAGLAPLNIYLRLEDLTALREATLDELERFVAAPGPVPPEVVATMHIAGTPGETGAHCTHCGAALGRPSDTEDFPAGAFVGLSCDTAVRDVVEPARTVPKRHAKKPRTAVNPDAERAQQTSEGRKAKRAKKR